METEENPKPVFIIESLTPLEKENLVGLIREYINVFTWNYENMLSLDPQVAIHWLNMKPDPKPLKQQQRCIQPS